MNPSKPITSQAEANQVKAWLIDQTATAYAIQKDEATRRVEALYKSGILDKPGAGPMNPYTQAEIEAFLSIDSSAYAHLAT